MNRKLVVLSALLAGLAAAGTAQAGNVSWSIGISAPVVPGVVVGAVVSEPPVYYRPAPVYVAPAPVYVAPPPPVYYRPAPVVYAPAPVYVQPAPVYVSYRWRHRHHHHDWDD